MAEWAETSQTRKIYSDHYPIIVKLKNLQPERIQSDKVSHWNLTVPKGWKMYESLLTKIAQKIDTIVEDEYLDIEDVKKKTDAYRLR